MFSNRTIVSAEQVIDLLHASPPTGTTSMSPGYDPQLDYTSLVANFMERLRRYLQGHGVPKNSDGSSLFNDIDDQDALSRPKLFLHSITESPFLPIDPGQKIRVSRSLNNKNHLTIVIRSILFFTRHMNGETRRYVCFTRHLVVGMSLTSR